MKGVEEMAKIEIEAMTTFYDKQEEWIINQMLEDMNENPKKYQDVVIFPVEREKVIDLIKKGQKHQDLEQQIAVLKQALELACQDISIVKILTRTGLDGECVDLEDVVKYYIYQAEKEQNNG